MLARKTRIRIVTRSREYVPFGLKEGATRLLDLRGSGFKFCLIRAAFLLWYAYFSLSWLEFHLGIPLRGGWRTNGLLDVGRDGEDVATDKEQACVAGACVPRV